MEKQVFVMEYSLGGTGSMQGKIDGGIALKKEDHVILNALKTQTAGQLTHKRVTTVSEASYFTTISNTNASIQDETIHIAILKN